MTRYLLDSNVIIGHIHGLVQLPAEITLFSVSVLSVFEVYALAGIDWREETSLKTFLNKCDQIPITGKIAQRAAWLARTHRSGTVDLLIAATALELDFILVTKNIKDFKIISDLKVIENF